jgi:hypothetical protein
MDSYPIGFEECDDLRSAFIHQITLQLCEAAAGAINSVQGELVPIPRKIVRFWHDPSDCPEDVRACLKTWNILTDEGFEFRMFDDVSAASYIADVYGERECQAFTRCSHPAMRCDYLRICFVLAEGGLYVDADDVLLGDGWRHLFRNGKLKLQPLGYDIAAGEMMPASDIWRSDLSNGGRVFYVNNDPIAAPPDHPVLRRALIRATEKLLRSDASPEIQSTTGPGNITAALAGHARHLQLAGLPFDFELLRDWDSIAEMRWNLSYRADSRNWRNVYGC